MHEQDEAKFVEIIQRVNGALDSVNRPIGRRVFNAMYNYIANYPSWVGSRFEYALADQLEQMSNAGISGTTLSFVDYAKEFPYFRDEVIPRLEQKGLRQPVK